MVMLSWQHKECYDDHINCKNMYKYVKICMNMLYVNGVIGNRYTKCVYVLRVILHFLHYSASAIPDHFHPNS